MGALALVGMGSNLGDRQAHLDSAVAALAETPGITVLSVSRYQETTPVGGPAGQGAFLNAAASLETTLEPQPLLERLRAIENEEGRVRTVRWGERTLDLDLLLFGDEVIDTPTLRVPHRRMALRRFVLAPLAEIAPDSVDPITGRTTLDLLRNLDRRPSYVAIAAKPDATDLYLALWEKMGIDKKKMLNLFSSNASLLFRSEAGSLHARLCKAIPAVAIEDGVVGREVGFLEPLLPSEDELASGTIRSGFQWAGRVQQAMPAGWLDAESISKSVPSESWLVSQFWFDTLFLAQDSLKSSRPRYRRFCDDFLASRSKVLLPTFVVVRPADRARYAIQDPRFEWFRPIGWDTPVLEVDDFDSESTVSAIVTACAATRAG